MYSRNLLNFSLKNIGKIIVALLVTLQRETERDVRLPGGLQVWRN